ncbi:hypothetical protein INT47_011640 [Mucor saturninus]|uniref:Uncharacterized protein n=1 Tax=Mucor saturninus TaxID=64648 RepID=A0A8H7V3I5_9FUNG|nr:hypothetical protein INT47_011640 [Mucor saturninus]
MPRFSRPSQLLDEWNFLQSSSSQITISHDQFSEICNNPLLMGFKLTTLSNVARQQQLSRLTTGVSAFVFSFSAYAVYEAVSRHSISLLLGLVALVVAAKCFILANHLVTNSADVTFGPRLSTDVKKSSGNDPSSVYFYHFDDHLWIVDLINMKKKQLSHCCKEKFVELAVPLLVESMEASYTDTSFDFFLDGLVSCPDVVPALPIPPTSLRESACSSTWKDNQQVDLKLFTNPTIRNNIVYPSPEAAAAASSTQMSSFGRDKKKSRAGTENNVPLVYCKPDSGHQKPSVVYQQEAAINETITDVSEFEFWEPMDFVYDSDLGDQIEDVVMEESQLDFSNYDSCCLEEISDYGHPCEIVCGIESSSHGLIENSVLQVPLFDVGVLDEATKVECSAKHLGVPGSPTAPPSPPAVQPLPPTVQPSPPAVPPSTPPVPLLPPVAPVAPVAPASRETKVVSLFGSGGDGMIRRTGEIQQLDCKKVGLGASLAMQGRSKVPSFFGKSNSTTSVPINGSSVNLFSSLADKPEKKTESKPFDFMALIEEERKKQEKQRPAVRFKTKLEMVSGAAGVAEDASREAKKTRR